MIFSLFNSNHGSHRAVCVEISAAIGQLIPQSGPFQLPEIRDSYHDKNLSLGNYWIHPITCRSAHKVR